MNVLEHTYRALLADVSALSQFSEVRGSWYGLAWCINDAPKLDKQHLGYIETGSNPVSWPSGLKRLADSSLTDPLHMRYLRQLLLFCYKAEITFTREQLSESVATFVATNAQVGQTANSYANASPLLLNRARRHVMSVLYKSKFRNILPSHGPGAVTTDKDTWSKLYATIESLYPYSDFYCLPNRDDYEKYDDLEHTEHITAKLTAVPKDSRGPRLICVHPAEAMWIQQGTRRVLEKAISRRRKSKGIWPCGHIFFDNQTVNGKVALLSSKSRKYATLDLKEASDRIPDILVQILFGSYYKYFGCSRAQKVIVRQGPKGPEVIDCHMFGPMGNANVFPVESLIFWAISVAALETRCRHRYPNVFVVGDDLLVPTWGAQAVIDGLESFGFVVNKAKSFVHGAFRESCGVDAFNGIDVTPLRWKTRLEPTSYEELSACCDLAKRLRLKGYFGASAAIYSHVRAQLSRFHRIKLPYGNNAMSSGLYEHCLDSMAWSNAYWHRDHQLWCHPVYVLKVNTRKGAHRSRNCLLESVLSLERTGRSNVPCRTALSRFRLELSWMPIL